MLNRSRTITFACLLVASAAGGCSNEPPANDVTADGDPPGPQPGARTWQGHAVHEGATIGVRFDLTEDAAGRLTGDAWFTDPVSGQPAYGGILEGSRSGATLSWTLEAGMEIVGTQDGHHFSGELRFPQRGGLPPMTADLDLAAEQSS